MTKSSFFPVWALMMGLAITVFCYWPGLKGGFLFDDYRNLEDLGAYGGVEDWESFKSFVMGGWSGPLGRPVSLMSFLLDDNRWPSSAHYFKPTNLAFHLLCGLLLIWASLMVLRLYGRGESEAQWLAVFSGACWLLHPYLVSTTLYTVQRMSQLAALFVLAGITGYLHGRRLLPERPRAAYTAMAGALVMGTVLATLSKENGALLPLLVGVIDFCAPKQARTTAPAPLFRAVFIGIPSLLILGYLASLIDFSTHPWPERGFNQVERLLSEPRIVWDYLGNLLLPRIEGQGLYRDDFAVSRDLLTPTATLPALLGLLALVLAALTLRRRWPLFSLAVLFFLAGHLLESTVIGLELSFEHRNYLPSAFLFLPIGSGLAILARHTRKQMAAAVAVTLLLWLAFFTWQRTRLWGDTERLELYWATRAANSPRAQNALAAYYLQQGRIDEADRQIESAVARLPDSALLTMRLLLQKVWAQKASEADFERAAARLARQPFDAQAVVSLRTLVERIIEPDQPAAYRLAVLGLLVHLQANATYNRVPLFIRLIPYLKAQVYLAEHKPELAYSHLSEAMERYADTDAALQMVALMGSYGDPERGLRLLDQAELLYRRQPARTLKRSTTVYDREFPRLRQLLHDDLQQRSSFHHSASP